MSTIKDFGLITQQHVNNKEICFNNTIIMSTILINKELGVCVLLKKSMHAI